MKQFATLFFVGVLVLVATSCKSTQTSPTAGMRHHMLDLRINPVQQGDKLLSHELHLDGAFIGNYNPDNARLRLYPGEHTIKVISEGFETQERTINIIGGSNSQSVHINLKNM